MTILEGLKIINKSGLPHPEWEFVKSSKGLNKFFKIRDYTGWTIRTVKIKNGPWKNLYVNELPKKLAPAKIDELQVRQQNKAIFIIYPFWKWKKSGTILIEKDRVSIESIKGPIVDLMRNGKMKAGYYYKKGKLIETIGNADFLSFSERKKILQARKKIKMKGIILEWAITSQNKFIFYRVEKVSEAAKLLIKKYS